MGLGVLPTNFWGGIKMPKNLRHIFRTTLIKQRKSGLRVARNEIKRSKNGKYTDYRHIYSDNSYRKHWSRAQKFAEYCQTQGIKSMNEITPKFAENYLIFKKNKSVHGYTGYSASTLASDALCINHIMIGAGIWKENQRIEKSKIPDMPHRSQLLVNQRQKDLSATEWIERHPDTYSTYKDQIVTLRAFGLRRRELLGGSSRNGRDGLGDRSLYNRNGHIWAITTGKGGKIRWIPCRSDMTEQIKEIYGNAIRPWSHRPKSVEQFRHNLKTNKVFYQPYNHNVPAHIFRAEYAQNILRELNTKKYFGTRKVPYYRRSRINTQGKTIYIKAFRKIDLNKEYKIGAYSACYGAFFQLAIYMGHNRLDVLRSYLGEGR